MYRVVRVMLIAVATVLLLGAAATVAQIAHQKFARLDAAKLPAGTRVDLSAAELNAWATEQARIYAPGATRNIQLVLTTGGASGTMLPDFLKVISSESLKESADQQQSERWFS